MVIACMDITDPMVITDTAITDVVIAILDH
jgi:hypothetical protein